MNPALIILLALGNKLADITYDGSGNITSVNIQGRKWIMTYNGSDLATIDGPGCGGLPITFTANTGVITGNRSPAGAFTYKYDGNGRLTGIGRA